MLEESRLVPGSHLRPLLKAMHASRKKRRVVSFGGVAPRGYPPCRKCVSPGFESLIEEDCGRVLEFADVVTAFETHPMVLDLGAFGASMTYTPDLLVWAGDRGALVEIKPASRLTNSKVALRVQAITRTLARHGVPLLLMLDTEVRSEALQLKLKLLQRERPARGRWRGVIDAAAWDPEYTTAIPANLGELWSSAKRECNALLDRVMRRDPDEFISSIQS